MNTNKLELKVGTTKIRDSKTSTAAVRPSKVSKPTRSNSIHLELRRDSPDKISKQPRPNTPDNEPATAPEDSRSDSKTENTKNTYRTPLFSLFPPVSQNGAIFGEDSESTKSWKRAYKNARYLMERQKARYLAIRKGREAILCKECETKGEKSLRIICQNSRKQNKGKHCEKQFLLEGHVVKESEKRTFDSRAIPTNLYLSKNYEMKTSFEWGYEKQNKPITRKTRELSKISFEKLQPWLTEDKNVKHRLKMRQDFSHGCSRMYLPHHC